MNRFFVIFFMIVGMGDFLYGIFSGDRISILVGGVIIALTIYVARRRKRTETDTTPPS